MPVNEKYSRKDFTGWDMTANTDMSGIIIEGSCFSHEKPDSQVFPRDMVNTTFVDCNLDNCIIPEGNRVTGGSQRRFKVQNDLNDWLVDDSVRPIKPLDHVALEKLGKPVPRPEDIPAQPVRERIDYMKDR